VHVAPRVHELVRGVVVRLGVRACQRTIRRRRRRLFPRARRGSGDAPRPRTRP
jgi:hypothetical protein